MYSKKKKKPGILCKVAQLKLLLFEIVEQLTLFY